MTVLHLYSNSLEGRFIEQSVEALREGSIIICPTGGIYALACDALNQRAVERLCNIKNLNPSKNSLSIICSDISQAAEYARIDNNAFRLLKEYTPGPFTFILPASNRLPKVFKGRKTVGVRIPLSPVARELAATLGNPIMASSVEQDTDSSTSGMIDRISEMYKSDVELIIDDGQSGSSPSTIVDLTDSSSPEIVRQGAGEFNE